MIRIVIPLKTCPKKNSQQIVYSRGRPIIIQGKDYLKFEKDCGVFLKPYALNIEDPIELRVIFYVPDRRRRDVVNLLNSIQDVLVHYHVLKDDNYGIVASLDGTRIIYEKGREETIIEITKLKGEDL